MASIRAVTICGLAGALALLAAGLPAQAPPANVAEPPGNGAETSSEPQNDMESITRNAGQIATQPVRDVGVARTTIPPVLLEASNDPYSLAGIRTCRQISAAIRALTEVLGPDFTSGPPKKENRAGKLAKAGGQTVVNSLIPFRGIVRELTGAAPAQRRRDVAIHAGHARRGFLRGVHATRKCRPAL